ncbi:MAG: Asp-tRNA(Asn)/Glu-tRNA(Gln) amidotransferase subunit GatB [Alphaproteobacteria bacterium]|nr:Asp-tRNA(Asn)/Glu-tRNA(Gln) amidotransferase subunit GatB [Alphaproteobacteria bacterium]
MSKITDIDLGGWEMVIGLEVHAQVSSASKLFSGASAAFGGKPNNHVSIVDAAMPGMLPILNEAALRCAVQTGLALKAKINTYSVFARKNYFYADLPQGYQISQYEFPIVGEGTIEITLDDGSTRTIGIERLHLEQDAGKSMHDQHPQYSFIDLNRSGVPLMEIVSKPDVRSAFEATAYVRKLANILDYIGACDVNMSQGSLRTDINLSLRRPGAEFGTRTETKNLNSLKAIRQAIEVEAWRQKVVLESGGTIDQETRLFDPVKFETRSLRSKEDAHDYRYFPDPDLLPVVISEDWIAKIQSSLPELPDQKIARFQQEFGLSAYDADVLVADQAAANFFEVVCASTTPKIAANWVIVELFGRLNKTDLSISDSPVSAQGLAELLALLEKDTISGRTAKDVLDTMFSTGKSATEIVKKQGLEQVSDTSAIGAIIDEVIASNPGQVQQFRDGNERLLGWFVGQVMRQSGGKANPSIVNQLLKQNL